MQLVNNIDIVQINIVQGVDEYYLPKNVNWRDTKVDKILLALASDAAGAPTVLSPIDGITQVLTRSDIADMYIDLYSADDTQIVRNLSFEQVLATNNHPLEINEVLSLNLSRLFFTTPPAVDGCILLYVFYNSEYREDELLANESITVDVPLEANGKISLQDIVDNYIYMQPKAVKGVYLWNWESKPAYLTLRYSDNIHVLNSIFSSICRPPLIPNGITTGEDVQAETLMFNNIAIDMLNSWVQNAQNAAATVKLTFLY